MRDVKDYLHLYLGCEVEIICQDYSGTTRPMTGKILENILTNYDPNIDSVRPLLRPLSDMTEEEAKVYFGLGDNVEIYQKIHYDKHTEFLYRWQDDELVYDTKDGKGYSAVAIAHDPSMVDMIPEQFLFLISKHFDIFGLIKSKLAIDKTTATNA